MQKPTTVTAQLQAWPRSSRDEGKQKVISEMHAEGFDTHKVAGAQRILCQRVAGSDTSRFYDC